MTKKVWISKEAFNCVSSYESKSTVAQAEAFKATSKWWSSVHVFTWTISSNWSLYAIQFFIHQWFALHDVDKFVFALLCGHTKRSSLLCWRLSPQKHFGQCVSKRKQKLFQFAWRNGLTTDNELVSFVWWVHFSKTKQKNQKKHILYNHLFGIAIQMFSNAFKLLHAKMSSENNKKKHQTCSMHVVSVIIIFGGFHSLLIVTRFHPIFSAIQMKLTNETHYDWMKQWNLNPN